MGNMQGEDSRLVEALQTLVQERGRAVLRNLRTVSSHLAAQKIPTSRILQVELILRESALVHYLDRMDQGLSSVECNNILISAEKTGLSDRVIRSTLSVLLEGLGVAQKLEEYQILGKPGAVQPPWDLYVPPEEYRYRLSSIETRIRGDKQITTEDLTTLNQFMRAGVPRAYRLMGEHLLNQQRPESIRQGEEYLQYAVDHGEVEAALRLADYYKDTDGVKAQQLYVRQGAVALDDRRRKNYLSLQQKKKDRRTQLWLMIGVFALVEAMMFLFAASPITGTHETVRSICTLVNLVNLMGLVVYHFRKPYQLLCVYGTPMILTLLVYFMALV